MAGAGPPGVGLPPSEGAEGKGWRGPERTCPGLGPGPAEEGIGLAEGAVGLPGAITAAGGIAVFGGAGAGAGAAGSGAAGTATGGGAGFAAGVLMCPPIGG
jgi:hypothetical protein